MKKLKITGQLIVLYVVIIVVSFVLFMTLSFATIQNQSNNVVLGYLSSYVETIDDGWKTGEEIEPVKLNGYYYISGKLKATQKTSAEHIEPTATIISVSSNIADDKAFETLVNNNQDIASYFASFVNMNPNQETTISSTTIDSNTIHYAYSVEPNENATSGMEVYFIMAIATPTASTFRGTILYQMALVFTVALAVTIVIMMSWSRNHVKRIQKLERHIVELPLTNYSEEYLDEGEDELGELSCSIEKMRKQIQTNDQTKQEMLQNISHDIKTPIGVIKSYAEAMQDKHCLDTGPDIIIKQSDILYNKTKQLITYNKLSYLTKDKEFEDVNMKRLIESVVNNFKVRKPEIIFNLDLDTTYFKGYSDNYLVVIENIVENALRYAKTKIDIKLKNGIITIYNDGEHIDQKFIDEGFKAYEKGSKGMFGLGMSIVVKTLDFFNYQLIVKNEEIGVTFKIIKKNLEKQ